MRSAQSNQIDRLFKKIYLKPIPVVDHNLTPDLIEISNLILSSPKGRTASRKFHVKIINLKIPTTNKQRNGQSENFYERKFLWSCHTFAPFNLNKTRNKIINVSLALYLLHEARARTESCNSCECVCVTACLWKSTILWCTLSPSFSFSAHFFPRLFKHFYTISSSKSIKTRREFYKVCHVQCTLYRMQVASVAAARQTARLACIYGILPSPQCCYTASWSATESYTRFLPRRHLIPGVVFYLRRNSPLVWCVMEFGEFVDDRLRQRK